MEQRCVETLVQRAEQTPIRHAGGIQAGRLEPLYGAVGIELQAVPSTGKVTPKEPPHGLPVFDLFERPVLEERTVLRGALGVLLGSGDGTIG